MNRASLEWTRTGKALTPPEMEALRGAASGESGPETAARTMYSPHTLRYHRQSVLAKLGAKTMTHAVALAYEHGIFVPNGNGFANGGGA